MSGDATVWTEVQLGSEGIGVTVYEEDDSGSPTVRDEWWATDAELEEMKNRDSPVNITLDE